VTTPHHENGPTLSEPNGDTRERGTEPWLPPIREGSEEAASARQRAPSRGLTSVHIRRLSVLALVLVLLGAGAGFGGATVWPPTYAARADLLYAIKSEKPTGFLRQDRSITTQLVLLNSRQVLAPVAASAGISVEDLQKQVSIAVLQDSEVIQVEARADSREEAVRRTQAIVGNAKQAEGMSRSAEAVDYLRGQLGGVQRDLINARIEADQLRAVSAAPSDRFGAEAKVESLSTREQQLVSRIDELSLSDLDKPELQVVVPPYAVTDPVSPKPLYAATAGALTAAVVAAGVVALFAFRWTRREND
jgi:hypothetical protein